MRKWYNNLHEDDRDWLDLIIFSTIMGTAMVLFIHGMEVIINAI